MINKVKGNKLYFAAEEVDVKIPTKEDHNAGYDIYAYFKDDYMLIQPHQTKMIPTGLLSACSNDYYIQLVERGSTGTKGIAQRCGVIDSSFRGAWFVPITNTTNKCIVIAKQPEDWDTNEVTIYPYNKAIAQAVVLPVPKMKIETISVDELKSIPSERGEGKIGSSGK